MMSRARRLRSMRAARLEQLDAIADRRERIAQLMAEHREEFVFRAVLRFGGFARSLRAREQALAFGFGLRTSVTLRACSPAAPSAL